MRVIRVTCTIHNFTERHRRQKFMKTKYPNPMNKSIVAGTTLAALAMSAMAGNANPPVMKPGPVNVPAGTAVQIEKPLALALVVMNAADVNHSMNVEVAGNVLFSRPLAATENCQMTLTVNAATPSSDPNHLNTALYNQTYALNGSGATSPWPFNISLGALAEGRYKLTTSGDAKCPGASSAYFNVKPRGTGIVVPGASGMTITQGLLTTGPTPHQLHIEIHTLTGAAASAACAFNVEIMGPKGNLVQSFFGPNYTLPGLIDLSSTKFAAFFDATGHLTPGKYDVTVRGNNYTPDGKGGIAGACLGVAHSILVQADPNAPNEILPVSGDFQPQFDTGVLKSASFKPKFKTTQACGYEVTLLGQYANYASSFTQTTAPIDMMPFFNKVGVDAKMNIFVAPKAGLGVPACGGIGQSTVISNV